MNEKMETLQDNFNMLLSAVDNMNSKFDIWITEKAAIDHALIRHDDKLDNHEVRIKQLEIRRA